MSDESATPRIVDAVFARAPRVRRRGVVGALVAGTALHAGLVGWAVVSAPSLETWSAELATRVHAQLTREEAIELPKPPPPPEKPKVEPPTPPPQRPIARARRMVEPRNAPPPPPAEAGKILAADPSAPVDLTATTFVTGTASTYAGGITSTK